MAINHVTFEWTFIDKGRQLVSSKMSNDSYEKKNFYEFLTDNFFCIY